MQIELLKVFCDIVETQSFSRAAARNYISQSAVSQQVRSLEVRYGRRLIERGKGSIAPTPAGEILLRGAREILERFQQVDDELQNFGQSTAGNLRVATVYSVGLHELPPFLTQFLRTHPQSRIQLEYDRSARIYDAVASGAIDLGIVAYPTRRAGIEIMPFRRDRLVLIAAPENPLARGKEIEVAQLKGARFVAFERDVPTRRAVDRILGAHDAEVEIVMEFDNIETIKRAVEINAGVSIVPLLTVRAEVRARTLRALPFAGDGHFRELGLLVRRGRTRPPILDRFIELLQRRSRGPASEGATPKRPLARRTAKSSEG